MEPEVNAGLPASDPQPIPPVDAPKYNALMGPRGLRAGWKYLFFMILLIIVVVCASIAAAIVFGRPRPGKPIPFHFQYALQISEAILVLLVTALMAKVIDKKPFGYFGLPGNRAFRSEFWVGAVIGFGALFAQLCMMKAGGWFDFGPMVLHGGQIAKYAAIWGLFFLGTGFFEEGMLRGYPQRVVTDGFSFLGPNASFWVTALIFSTIFACLHLGNPGENKFGIVMVFIDGMLMCFSVWRTGTLWFAVGNHAAWDWGQTFFFGTPDSGMKTHGALFSPSFHGPVLLSGGTDGPEGSVLVVLAELLIAVAIAVIYRKRKYPLLQDEPQTGPAELPPAVPQTL
ncbi:MAG TPA: type II CAAX endopeptidase family protein [Candidatus Koribacter sp.]|jgi:hypothetical protein